MHDFEVIGELKRDWKVDPINRLIRSKQYVLADEAWLFGDGAEALRWYFKKLGLDRYVENGNHCAHFANRAACFLQDLHVRHAALSSAATAPGGTSAAEVKEFALAVGEFYYQRNGDPSKEHAVVISMTANAPGGAGRIRPVFLEPQALWRNGGRMELLSEAERISCTGLGL